MAPARGGDVSAKDHRSAAEQAAMNVASTPGNRAMMRKIRAAGIIFGLVLLATPSMAFMHGMMGMGAIGSDSISTVGSELYLA